MDRQGWSKRRSRQVRAKRLRLEMSATELLLWEAIRKRVGTRVRRQVAIGPFVADFACLPLKLVIEIDGPTHEGRQAYDAERTEKLASLGFKVVRYTNEQVLGSLDAVVADIRRIVDERGER